MRRLGGPKASKSRDCSCGKSTTCVWERKEQASRIKAEVREGGKEDTLWVSRVARLSLRGRVPGAVRTKICLDPWERALLSRKSDKMPSYRRITS